MHSAPQFSRDSRLLPVPDSMLPLSSKCPVWVDCGGWGGGSGELLRSLQTSQEMTHTMLALPYRNSHVSPLHAWGLGDMAQCCALCGAERKQNRDHGEISSPSCLRAVSKNEVDRLQGWPFL